MANKNVKAEKNVSGKYYVDNNCISCGQCVGIARNFFAEESTGVYIKSQPSVAEEIRLCEEALSNCPVGAIGDDGEIF